MIPDSKSFAYLKLPDGRVRLGLGPFCDLSARPDNQPAFYLNSFTLDNPAPWKLPSRFYTVSPEEAIAILTNFLDLPEDRNHPTPSGLTWSPGSKSRFSRVFAEIASAIRRGELVKAVPVSTSKSSLASTPTIARWCLDGLRKSGSFYNSCWFTPGMGHFGFTPELLFSLNNGILRTMALASTAALDDIAKLSANPKEIHEHEAVANFLARQLGNSSTLIRHPRQILALGSIAHFITRFELPIGTQTSPDFWINQLHPTPALGILPRTPRTLANLANWRAMTQTPTAFGAPFGVSEDPDNFTATVQIRTIFWEHSMAATRLSIPTGCGVVNGSTLDREWRELELKRQSILDLASS